MQRDVRNALLAATACILGLGAQAPAMAATIFVSAEATAYAAAGTRYTTFPILPPVTKSDTSSTARRLAAEAEVTAGVALQEDTGHATSSVLADFAPDGSQGMLSVGYDNFAGAFGPFGEGFGSAEVRYSFVYRFDVDTLSRFIADWTVGFPQDVTISLAGPSVLSGPLPAAFGSHSLLLQPGRYELTFSARDFISDEAPGYHIGTLYPKLVETQGFDLYTFLIFETVAPPVPEPGTGALVALGVGWLGMVISRRRCRREAASGTA